MNTILTLSAAGSALALILLALRAVCKNKVSRTFSYYLWLLVLLRLALPLPSPFRFAAAIPQAEQNAAVSEPAPARTETAQALPAVSGAKTEAPAAQAGPTFRQWLRENAVTVWALGAGLSAVWYLAACLRFSRLLRRSREEPDEEDARVFERERGGRNVRLIRSGLVPAPMLTGAFRPAVVLPTISYVKDGREDELRYILRHELVHARRRDILYKWAVVLVASAHWFNPLMPLLRRVIGRDCELACDEAVIKDLSEDGRRAYAKTLLAGAAGRRMAAGATFGSGKRELKGRLTGIMNYKKKTKGALALMAALALLLTGCAAALGVQSGNVAVPEAGSEPVAAQSAAASSAPAAAEPDGTGPFAVKRRDGLLDIYTAKDGSFIRSLPLTLLTQFPGMENAADGWLDGVDVYCGTLGGDFVWAAAATGPHLGTGTQNVCTSSDGGRTWFVGDPSAMYTGTVTGAGFASPAVGFMCFRYFFDQGPEIARTEDGGRTWTRLEIQLPDELSAYNLTPLVPVFDGENGSIPVEASAKDGGDTVCTVQLTTADGGLSWSWDTSGLPGGAVDRLLGSAQFTDGQFVFQIPADFPDPENLNINIAGRAESSDGFSQSLHLLEDVNTAKGWAAGKTYTLPFNSGYTELTMTVFYRNEEKSLDLLRLTTADVPAVTFYDENGGLISEENNWYTLAKRTVLTVTCNSGADTLDVFFTPTGSNTASQRTLLKTVSVADPASGKIKVTLDLADGLLGSLEVGLRYGQVQTYSAAYNIATLPAADPAAG